MIMKKWRASDFGKRGTGSNSSVVGPITLGDINLGNKVLSDTDWHPSALYVVDLVRFRQMAAGVSTFL
jgi:hypothetical protein